jgi:hypothetical protein
MRFGGVVYRTWKLMTMIRFFSFKFLWVRHALNSRMNFVGGRHMGCLQTCQSLFRNFFAHCTILLFTALSTISRTPSGSDYWNSKAVAKFGCYANVERNFFHRGENRVAKVEPPTGRQKDSHFWVFFNYKIGQQNAASLVVGLCYRSLHPAGLELFWILSATIFRFLISLSCTT